MFFVILAILSLLLIGLNYQNSKRLNEKIAQERLEQNAHKVKLAYAELTSPLHLLLNMLANSRLNHSPTIILDKDFLKSIGTVLEKNAIIHALYAGYENDDFIIINMIKDNNQGNAIVPLKAKFQVKIYNADNKEVKTSFFDKDYHLISETVHQEIFTIRNRPWYKNAKENRIFITSPYEYQIFNLYGITFSTKSSYKNSVVAIDITLDLLQNYVKNLDLFRFYKNTEIIISDENKNIITQRNNGIKSNEKTLLNVKDTNFKRKRLIIDQEYCWVKKEKISKDNENELNLLIAISENELLSDVFKAIKNQILYALVAFLIGGILVSMYSKKIVTPLKRLTHLANRFSHLHFKGSKIPRSKISEINDLATSFNMVSSTIDKFLTTLTLVSSTENLNSLLQNIVEQCKDTAKADFALLWTKNEKKDLELAAFTPNKDDFLAIHYEDLIKDLPILEENFNKNQPLIFSIKDHQFIHTKMPKELKQVWIIPMVNRKNANVGSIFLGFSHMLTKEEEEKVHFLHEFLGFISLIHENWTHLYEQKHLFLSLTEMIASAIDAKSPYTGGHCQRVPELTAMLAKATDQDKKYHAEFTLDEKSSEALHLAAWLHDCGKLTTPDYVIDKATKLETSYNRIHEIRTRFEIIKRDLEIRYWKKRLNSKSNKKSLKNWLKNELNQVNEEFAFVAKMNQSESLITQKEIEKLESIASRTWYRTLHDDIGLSWEEKYRLKDRIEKPLPVKEPLLKNAKEQQIPWSSAQKNQFKEWPFKMKPNELQFDQGELYNLSIQHGTLTKEDRFIINNHIVQTIRMLNKLPYPEHLAQIPEIAGGHHEKMNGSGYPMGLNASNFCIEARIIAIADIFEALTAKDRPYKSLKTINESLEILAKMARENHIDKGLFRIFVEKKVYLEYAKYHLTPEQCDKVDEKALFALLEKT